MMRKAPRHRGIKASRRSLAFSLIEVLLAVFILGVGVIAIAALFPAGIAQQRQSVDDTIGPIVANNALAVLRSKLHPEDFGFLLPSPTIEGDFPWSRPAFFTQPATLGGSVAVSAGSISIFNTVGISGAGAITPSEIPSLVPAVPPNPPIIITQGERYYPMFNEPLAGAASNFPPRPQYVWDCLFRRFQGKVMVAIFVYRVTIPGGGAASYVVAPGPSGVPPLPAAIDLTTTPDGPWDVFGEDGVPSADDAVIPGTQPDSPLTFYTPVSLDGFSLDAAMNQGWQAPGQWMLDQNNNVHRVLSGRRNKADGPVELVRPVSSMPPLPVYFMPDVVTNIWYIPPVDGNGLTLTPVYVTVREL